MSDARSSPTLLWIAAAIAITPILAFPAAWAGWLVFYASFALVLRSPVVMRKPELGVVVVSVVGAHQAVAFFHSFVSVIADRDAEEFHAAAEMKALGELPFLFERGSTIFSDFLGLCYWLLGPSRFLGSQLAILGFVVAIRVLLSLAHDLGVRKLGSLTLCFGLLPTCLLFCSVPLREGWQIAFVLIMVSSTIDLRRRVTLRRFSALVLAATGLAMQHRGLGVFAVFGLLFSLYWALAAGSGQSQRRYRLAFFVLAGAVLVASFSFASYLGSTFEALAGGGDHTLSYLEDQFSRYKENARATYGMLIDASSISRVVMTVPLAFVYYIAAPFPWQIQTAGDVYAFLEGCMRIGLLTVAIWAVVKSRRDPQPWLTYMLAMFLLLETLWSAGTINWGTALRHHLPAYPLLLLAASPRVFGQIPAASSRRPKAGSGHHVSTVGRGAVRSRR